MGVSDLGGGGEESGMVYIFVNYCKHIFCGSSNAYSL